MRNQERFVSTAPGLIGVAALAVIALVFAGADLAAQVLASIITFLGALAWFWFSRARWTEWNSVDKALSICLAGLLIYGAFGVPALAALADASSVLRWPLMVVGILLTIVCTVLLIARAIRGTES